MSEATRELRIGEELPDGTKFAGISPDTKRPMYVRPVNEPGGGIYDFYQAAQHARDFEGHGHNDFRVPSKNELGVILNNSSAIGGFEKPWSWLKDIWCLASRKPNYDALYGSSSLDHGYTHAWSQRVTDGRQFNASSFLPSSLRLVRG